MKENKVVQSELGRLIRVYINGHRERYVAKIMS